MVCGRRDGKDSAVLGVDVETGGGYCQNGSLPVRTSPVEQESCSKPSPLSPCIAVSLSDTLLSVSLLHVLSHYRVYFLH